MGTIPRPYLPIGALYWHHCLSRDFTGSAKCPLEKQTSQHSLAKTLCMGSAWVRLLAGTIKWTWACVTLWSVFQYPVTYELFMSITWSSGILIIPIRRATSPEWLRSQLDIYLLELRWVKASRATGEGIIIVCDQILENRPNCHIEYFEKYRF